jgi:hypothetical protein
VTATKQKKKAARRKASASKTSKSLTKHQDSDEVSSPDHSAVSDEFRSNKQLRREQTRTDMQNSAAQAREVSVYQAKIHTLEGEFGTYKVRANKKMGELRTQRNALRAENGKLKAEITALEGQLSLSRAPDRKVKDKDRNGQVCNYVKMQTKAQFRTTKFVTNEAQLLELADAVMAEMEMDDLIHQPNETPAEAKIVDCNRAAFVKLYLQVMSQSLNEQRSYVQSEMKKASLEWLKTHKDSNPSQKLYPIEDLELVMKRDLSGISEEGPKNLAYYHEVMDFYVDKLVPTIAGSHFFGENIRHFEPLSTTKCWNDNLRVMQPRVPAGTEAFVLLMYKNCKEKWEAMHDWSVVQGKKEPYPRYKKSEPTMNTEFKALYSDSASGQSRFGGWNKAGLKEYARLQLMMIEVREENAELCEEVDRATVARIFEANKAKHERAGDNADGKSRRKSKKRRRNDMGGGDDSDDDSVIIFVKES